MALLATIRTADGWHLGEDKTLRFTVYQPGTTTAQIAAGTALAQNLTGWTLSWMLKRRLEDLDAAAAVTKSTAGGIAITDATAGKCEVTVADTDTDALEAATYYHELKRTNAGFEAVLSSGPAALVRGVHRA